MTFSRRNIRSYHQGLFEVTDTTLAIAEQAMTLLWNERLSERGLQPNADRAGSCKFAALLARHLFGGRLAGNKDHVFTVHRDGCLIDLNESQFDILELGEKAHRMECEILSAPEYRESLFSCVSRVTRWADWAVLQHAAPIHNQKVFNTENAPTMKNYTAEAPNWLEDILGQLNPPKETIPTDPADTKKVLSNLNMAGCKFDHADGEVRMGVYAPCTDPETKEGVGLAVIFLGDDTRLYRRAKSIQGAHLEEAAAELLGDYLKTFNKPSIESDAAPEDFSATWMADGYEINSTGGGFYAAMKTVDGVEFWVTNSDESRNPNPDQQLTVGAYVPRSGVWLEFTENVANKEEADAGLQGWAKDLQGALSVAVGEEEQNVVSTKARPGMSL
jgi:hypothetical protein